MQLQRKVSHIASLTETEGGKSKPNDKNEVANMGKISAYIGSDIKML